MNIFQLIISYQVVIDEFEQRIEETHSKGVADDEVAQKASKVSVTARAARGAKSAKTPGNYYSVQYLRHYVILSMLICCHIETCLA